MPDSNKLQIPEAAKDVGIAVGSVLLVFLLTFAYSGNWPPMVVIESGSMEHDGHTNYKEPGYTHLGIIDTGDLVIVKEAGKSDIVTYLEGKKTGYEKYGDYGDVIVYYKNGIKEHEGSKVTPVIHRAMAWVDVLDNGSYYIPEINIYYENKIVLDEIGLPIGHGISPTNSGYITKGDSINNRNADQFSHTDVNGARVQPADPDWVIGMARGELPWIGLIKLKITQPENYDQAPSGCKSMLWFSIILILVGPYTVGKVLEVRAERSKSSEKNKSKR